MTDSPSSRGVAIFGTNGGTFFSERNFDHGLNSIGLNTGNALFQFAVWRLINEAKFAINAFSNIHAVREKTRVLIIPAANQVNPAWDFGPWADFVEKLDLPCAMVGLGAQAPIGGGAKMDLQPGTLRYFKVVSERTKMIGVRGPFTQDVLAAHGITNTIVTGCPTQTIRPNIRGKDIQDGLKAATEGAIRQAGYVMGTLEESARKAEAILANAFAQENHEIIFQTDPRILRALYENEIAQDSADYISWYGRLIRPDLNKDEFAEYLLSHGTFYSDARTWIDKMRRFDLVVGMRIHGTIAAVVSGRPGICVAFDSRTKELASTMGYPYVESSKLESGDTLSTIASKAVFDAARFDHLKQVNGKRIREIIGAAGCRLIS